MNEFRLFAHGENFNPDAYILQSSLRFDGAWHKGERGHDHPKSSGVFVYLGDGENLPYCEQEQIAIEFLKANSNALKELAQQPDITTFILGIQYHQKLQNTVGFTISPSAQLMSLCENIGIELVYYVSFDPLSWLEPRQV